MEIGVIGAGGVGGYFGAKLAISGYDVVFLARGENLKAMRHHGLKIKSIHGDFSVNPVRVTDKYGDLADAEFILLSTKAWQVREVAESLKGIIRKDAVVLPLQNGVMAYEELSGVLGSEHALQGLCRIFSKIEAPGVILHMGFDPLIIFGENNNEITDRITRLKDIFDRSRLQSRITTDIHSEVWKKFINICASGLLAVTHSTYGQLREMKETRRLMQDLFSEIYALAIKIGICIEPEFLGKTMDFVDSYAYDSTSSLTRDVWEGKPSELEYQNGTVVRLGEKYGVPTPVNKFIYECLLPQERRARKQ
jgi:2-dehydropantoate 2-reductase